MKDATQGPNRLGVNIGMCGFIPLVIISAHGHNACSNREFNKMGNRNRHSANCPSKQ